MKKDKNQEKSFAPVIAVISALTLIVAACCAFLVAGHINPELRTSLSGKVEKTQTEPEKPEVKNATARLMCAGDNMIYRSVYNYAASLAQEGEEKYNFAPIYENIKSTIAKADVAMISQPTVLSGKIEASTQPDFCTPTQAGDALYDLGFTVINHASSHVFDKGEDGAKDTLEYWATKENAIVTGLYKNETDRETVRVKEVNGIKIAFVSFTESIQSTVSSDSKLSVVSLGDNNLSTADVYNQMKNMIKAAKKEADVVVASMYFTSGLSDIASEQQQTIDYLVSFGADVIIGCGSNEIQPIERVTGVDGNSAVVCYSLGNFMSADDYKENMLGGIADITFEKNAETGETIVKTAKVIPVITYYEKGYTNFSLIKGDSVKDEDLESHSLYSSGLNAAYADEAFGSVFKAVEKGAFTEKTTDEQENPKEPGEGSDEKETKKDSNKENKD